MAELRIYTDSRFPGMQVTNEGTQFTVSLREAGEEIDQFEAQEVVGAGELSEAFSARRAQVYFERLFQEHLDDIDQRHLMEDDHDILGLPPDRDHHDIVNNPARDFADEQVLTPDAVLAMWERAQAMGEGPDKEALLQQVRSAASQLESAAEEIVSRLLS